MAGVPGERRALRSLEYVTGFILDRVNGGYWGWDYNAEKLNFGNLGGYVCLRSVIMLIDIAGYIFGMPEYCGTSRIVSSRRSF
ncbi:MAG: hypothetical protein IKQ97_11195 [Eubacterium sp.]|nr:hypothetical protein [Eubacterium sp.]